jgi:hypothetical protein
LRKRIIITKDKEIDRGRGLDVEDLETKQMIIQKLTMKRFERELSMED